MSRLFFSLLSCLTIFILTYKNRMPSQNNYKLLQIYCSTQKIVYKKNHFGAWEKEKFVLLKFFPSFSLFSNSQWSQTFNEVTFDSYILRRSQNLNNSPFSRLFSNFVAFLKNINFNLSTFRNIFL